MALTDFEVKKAKATDKPTKLADGGGLFLLVQSNGAKYWRLAYRFAGKQKTLALGVYPDVSLACQTACKTFISSLCNRSAVNANIPNIKGEFI